MASNGIDMKDTRLPLEDSVVETPLHNFVAELLLRFTSNKNCAQIATLKKPII